MFSFVWFCMANHCVHRLDLDLVFWGAIIKNPILWHRFNTKFSLTLSLNTNFSALHQSKKFSIGFTLSSALNFFSKSGISSSASSDRFVAILSVKQCKITLQLVSKILATALVFCSSPRKRLRRFFSKQVPLLILQYHWKCQRKPPD